MIQALTDKERAELKQGLESRLVERIEETRQLLLASDDEQYVARAGEVHDLEEESVADLLKDVQLADIDRHVEEIRDIEAALLRLADGTYGLCADCGNPIGHDRLAAYPTAKRCVVCQEQHEKTHRQPGRATL